MNPFFPLALAAVLSGCATAGPNGDVATYDTLKVARAACEQKNKVLVLRPDGNSERMSAYECRSK